MQGQRSLPRAKLGFKVWIDAVVISQMEDGLQAVCREGLSATTHRKDTKIQLVKVQWEVEVQKRGSCPPPRERPALILHVYRSFYTLYHRLALWRDTRMAQSVRGLCRVR